MGALLALASSLCYGLSDFAGGLLSRRASFVAVAMTGQAGGLVLTALAAPTVPATGLTASDLGWGALSGAGTGLGMMFLFRGLSRGAMSVVAPVSSVGGAAFPVLVGVAVLAERPSALAWTGIAVAIPALWLVTRSHGQGTPTTTLAAGDGLIASTGFALQYLALAQAGPDSGIWPVAAGRVTAILVIVVLAKPATGTSVQLRLPAPLTLGAAATGAAAALALVFYLLATRHQLLTTAVVLSSLYPLIPVLLGITLLHERLTWTQAAGLVAALAAVGLITTR